MKAFILSLQFLTRFPIPIEVEASDKTITQSIALYPLISWIIGALVGLILELFHTKNPMMAAFFSLLVWVILTGGLHIDGFTDTFDGFLANRDREETLRIMSDPNIGSYGALALLFLILGKLIFLYTVSLNWLDVAFICLVSRLCVLMDIDFFPTAKKSGMGYFLKQRSSRKLTIFEFLLTAFILYFYEPIFNLVLVLLLLINLLVNRIFVKKLGGLSGDIYGFTMEFSELLGLAIFGVIQLWS